MKVFALRDRRRATNGNIFSRNPSGSVLKEIDSAQILSQTHGNWPKISQQQTELPSPWLRDSVLLPEKNYVHSSAPFSVSGITGGKIRSCGQSFVEGDAQFDSGRSHHCRDKNRMSLFLFLTARRASIPLRPSRNTLRGNKSPDGGCS